MCVPSSTMRRGRNTSTSQNANGTCSTQADGASRSGVHNMEGRIIAERGTASISKIDRRLMAGAVEGFLFFKGDAPRKRGVDAMKGPGDGAGCTGLLPPR